jgi:putative FmdB family regulatory protein
LDQGPEPERSGDDTEDFVDGNTDMGIFAIYLDIKNENSIISRFTTCQGLILLWLHPIFSPFDQLYDYLRGIFVPIYEYQCEHCQLKMEAIQKFSDAPLKKCPECKQETLRKLVSAAAFKLKGGGWYETDFKDKKPQKKDGKEKGDVKPSKDKGSDKTGGSDKAGKKSDSKTVSAKKKSSTTSSSD